MLRAALAASAISAQAGVAPQPEIRAGLEAAFRACEQWVLKPGTWMDGADRFPQASGLADRLVPVVSVPEAALPPPSARRAMHHWRVPLGEGGIFVTASDEVPICHLAGGGPYDFQPAVEGVLTSAAFRSGWSLRKSDAHADLRNSQFVSKQNARLTMIVTRAGAAEARRDRVQFLATAEYRLGN